MAVSIEFEGFVNEVRHYDWGVALDVAHSQRMKNAGGQWETFGYDYFSVTPKSGTLPEGVEKGAKVLIRGTMKTKRYEKRDGSGTGLALNVRAESIEPVRRGASVPQMQQVWPEMKQVPEDNAPF
jgi:single-stranded DNA-binding protein